MEKEELFQKFKMAIESEYEAYQLYKDIAERSGDSELRAIFQKIASEEWEHRETIMKRYSILKDNLNDK
jgi:rubrerythrin